jgi:hypothetical protein
MSKWLDSVPVSEEAYAYNADLLCDDCGRAAVEELRSKGVEDNGDSNTFPQGPCTDGGGESDSAQFCGAGRKCVNAVEVAGHKVGCPLRCPLTRDGVKSVTEAVIEDMFSRKKFSNMVGRLIRLAWSDSLGDAPPERIKHRYASNLPDTLLHRCKVHHVKYTIAQGFHDAIFADLDHAYLLYEHGGVVDLCRSKVDDEGNFQALEVASVPAQVTQGKDPSDLIRDAVDEAAWD